MHICLHGLKMRHILVIFENGHTRSISSKSSEIWLLAQKDMLFKEFYYFQHQRSFCSFWAEPKLFWNSPLANESMSMFLFFYFWFWRPFCSAERHILVIFENGHTRSISLKLSEIWLLAQKDTLFKEFYYFQHRRSFCSFWAEPF